MKQLAWRSLAGCLVVTLGACTGTAVAPSPARTPPVPVASTATGTRPVPPASVASVVTGYYRAIVAGNYQRAFAYLAPDATGPTGQPLTQQAFLQLAHALEGMGGPVTRFSIGALPSGVVMTLYRVRYGPYHAHLRMARTKHGWAIGSIDRI